MTSVANSPAESGPSAAPEPDRPDGPTEQDKLHGLPRSDRPHGPGEPERRHGPAEQDAYGPAEPDRLYRPAEPAVGYAEQPPRYPEPTPGYAEQAGYPEQQAGYPEPTPGYAEHAGYPEQQAGYPEQQAGYYVPAAESDRFTRFVTRMSARAPRWLAPVGALVCMAGAAGYTLAISPAESSADAVPTCLLKYTTGFDCPGCGGTRALWFLLHGDLPAAARHHAIFVFAVPFLIYIYLAWAVREVFGRRLPQFTVTPKMIVWFLSAWGVFSILRNLPWAPFTSLYV